jgi:molybdate transport system substrate-binding protein
MKRLFSAVAIFLFVVAASAPARAQGSITASIVSRGDDGFKELIEQFTKKTGIMVDAKFPNYAASRDNIVKGEPFDVGIVEFPHDADVIASGNVVPGSEVLVANGWMAVAVKKGAPKPDISTPAAVKRMLLNAKSVAFPDPAQGASGLNIQMMFRRLGIEDAMKAKTKTTRGGPQAMGLAASGEVEIGMTYHIGMYGNDKIDIVGVLPAQICPPTPLLGFISSHSSNPAAAKQLLDFLTAPAAAPAYKKYLLEPAY